MHQRWLHESVPMKSHRLCAQRDLGLVLMLCYFYWLEILMIFLMKMLCIFVFQWALQIMYLVLYGAKMKDF